jgi:hypothetical protein
MAIAIVEFAFAFGALHTKENNATESEYGFVVPGPLDTRQYGPAAPSIHPDTSSYRHGETWRGGAVQRSFPTRVWHVVSEWIWGLLLFGYYALVAVVVLTSWFFGLALRRLYRHARSTP